MSRRLLLRTWALVWLMLVWILLWGNFSWANVLSGFAVAAGITLLLPLPVMPVEGRLHPLSLLRFVALVGWYLVESSLQVAWLALKPGAPPVNEVSVTAIRVMPSCWKEIVEPSALRVSLVPAGSGPLLKLVPS